MEFDMKTPLMKVDFSEKELLYLVLISEQGSVKKMGIFHASCDGKRLKCAGVNQHQQGHI